MAAVLPAPRKKDGGLSPDRGVRSPIKPYYLRNAGTGLKTPEPRYYEADGSSSLSSSPSSSAPTSPEITYTSFPFPSSEPATISLDSSEDEDDEIIFPTYDKEDFFNQGKELDPPASEVSDTQSTASPVTPTFPSEEPVDLSNIPKTAGDDNSIENEPTTQVDYLSHQWKEEELWGSWRFVTSNRDRFQNVIRLENASWRAWSKSKDNLQVISPARLAWRKDCDVTWLYGPLHCKQSSSSTSPSPPSHNSISNSILNKKPILKKPSASESILQRSLSTHTLLKHAGAIVEAQEARKKRKRAPLERSASEFAVPLAGNGVGSSNLPTNTTSPGVFSPSGRRRIHFNNEVSQCIAVEAKGCEERGDHNDFQLDDDEPSEDGLVTMKKFPSRTPIGHRSSMRGHSPNGSSKTIAPLPSTTLNREPEPRPPTNHYTFWSAASNLSSNLSSNNSSNFSSSLSSPSPVYSPNATSSSSNFSSAPHSGSSTPPSSQTPGPDDNFLLNDDDDDDNDHNDHSNFNFNFNWNIPQTSLVPPRGGAWFVNPNDDMEEEDGLNFPTPADSGLLDRVADTVNTARDIAHVIWNVGWRR